MVVTNEFERDLTNQAQLKHPGRVDMVVFQNIPDAGDGSPGIQRCFRNYLHEGGIEKDLELLGYAIKGTSVNISNAEMQQLSNIGSSIITASIWAQLDNIEATTISPAQWVFVGEADQPVKQADSPTFVGLTLSADLVTTSTIDGVDVSTISLNNQPTTATANIDCNAQAITNVGSVDGVDVSVFKSTYDTHAANTNAHISNLNQIPTRSHDVLSGVSPDDHHNESHNHTHNNLSGLNDGDSYEHLTQTQVNALHAIYTLQSHSKDYHSDIDQSLLTSNTVTFSKVNAGTIENSTHLNLNAGAGYNIQLNAGGQSRWKVWDDGDFKPFEAGVYDIGDATYDVDNVYACNVVDTSCADFSDKTADEIYNLFKQIQPRTDDIVHKTKNMTYPHIDFATIPDEFANKTDEDFVKENVVKMKTGIMPGSDKVTDSDIEMTTINYKKGDTCAIELGVFVYALKDLVVKSYEKIKLLEQEINELKGI